MKKLQKLTAAVVLTFVLALSAFAGQTETPPCPAPEPGQTETPPCAAAPGDVNDTSEVASTAPGDLGTAMLANNETSLGDIATAALLNFLSLY